MVLLQLPRYARLYYVKDIAMFMYYFIKNYNKNNDFGYS